jgi:hypothetical protein
LRSLGPQAGPNRPQTTPTGPRTTSNCSHISCSHIPRSPNEVSTSHLYNHEDIIIRDPYIIDFGGLDGPRGPHEPFQLEWFLEPPGLSKPQKSMHSGSRKSMMVLLIRSWAATSFCLKWSVVILAQALLSAAMIYTVYSARFILLKGQWCQYVGYTGGGLDGRKRYAKDQPPVWMRLLSVMVTGPLRKQVLVRRAQFCPIFNRENLNIGPPAGLRPAGGRLLRFHYQK